MSQVNRGYAQPGVHWKTITSKAGLESSMVWQLGRHAGKTSLHKMTQPDEYYISGLSMTADQASEAARKQSATAASGSFDGFQPTTKERCRFDIRTAAHHVSHVHVALVVAVRSSSRLLLPRRRIRTTALYNLYSLYQFLLAVTRCAMVTRP